MEVNGQKIKKKIKIVRLGENIEPFCKKINHPHCSPLFTNGGSIYQKCAPVFYDNQNPQTDCSYVTRCREFMTEISPIETFLSIGINKLWNKLILQNEFVFAENSEDVVIHNHDHTKSISDEGNVFPYIYIFISNSKTFYNNSFIRGCSNVKRRYR